MEKPSVTIQHKEAYFVSGIFFMFSLLAGILNGKLTVGPWGEQLLGYLLSAMGLLVAAVFFVWAKCTETLDENGICCHTPFYTRQYDWSKVCTVKICPPSGKDLPKIEIAVEGHKVALQLDYTKRTFACILYYYGEPDCDEYGKRPSIY